MLKIEAGRSAGRHEWQLGIGASDWGLGVCGSNVHFVLSGELVERWEWGGVRVGGDSGVPGGMVTWGGEGRGEGKMHVTLFQTYSWYVK